MKNRFISTAFWAVVSVLVIGCAPGTSSAQTRNFYSDGFHVTQFALTADSHYEDTHVSGVGGSLSSAGIAVFKASDAGLLPPVANPTWTPSPVAGPGLPASFGTYLDGVKPSLTGVLDYGILPVGYYVLDCGSGEFYQSAPGFVGTGDEGAVQTRFIDLDSVTQVNPQTPPPANPGTPPTGTTPGLTTPTLPGTVAIEIVQPAASNLPVVSVQTIKPYGFRPKNSNPAQAGSFVFSRTGATTNALPFNLSVGGTAAYGLDYVTTNGWTTASSLTFPPGASQITESFLPLIGTPTENTVEQTVIPAVQAGTGYTLGTTPATGYVEPIAPSTQLDPTITFTSPAVVGSSLTVLLTTNPATGKPIYPGDSLPVAVLAQEPGGGIMSVSVAQNGAPFYAHILIEPSANAPLNAGSFSASSAGDYTLTARAVDSNGTSTPLPNTTLIIRVSPSPDIPPSIQWDSTDTFVPSSLSTSRAYDLPGFKPIAGDPRTGTVPTDGTARTPTANSPGWFEADVVPGQPYDPRAISTAGVLVNGSSEANLGSVYVTKDDESFSQAAASGVATLLTPDTIINAGTVSQDCYYTAYALDQSGLSSALIHLYIHVGPPLLTTNVVPTVRWDDEAKYSPTAEGTNDQTGSVGPGAGITSGWSVSVITGQTLTITATGQSNTGDLGLVFVDNSNDQPAFQGTGQSTSVWSTIPAGWGTGAASDPGQNSQSVAFAPQTGGPVSQADGKKFTFNSPGTYEFTAQACEDPYVAKFIHGHATSWNSHAIHLTVVVHPSGPESVDCAWDLPSQIVPEAGCGDPTSALYRHYTTNATVTVGTNRIEAVGTSSTGNMGIVFIYMVEGNQAGDGNSWHILAASQFGSPSQTNGYAASLPVDYPFSDTGYYHFVAQAQSWDGALSQPVYLDVLVTNNTQGTGGQDDFSTIAWSSQSKFQQSSGDPATWTTTATVGGANGTVDLSTVNNDFLGNDLTSWTDVGLDLPSDSTTHLVSDDVSGADGVLAASFSPTAPGVYEFSARNSSSTGGLSLKGGADHFSPPIHLIVTVAGTANHAPTATWVSPTGSDDNLPPEDPSHLIAPDPGTGYGPTYAVNVLASNSTDGPPFGSIYVGADAFDQDGNLVVSYMDRASDTPPDNADEYAYLAYPGVSEAPVGNATGLLAGTSTPFSLLVQDAYGLKYETHLIVNAYDDSTSVFNIQWTAPSRTVMTPVTPGDYSVVTVQMHVGDPALIVQAAAMEFNPSNIKDIWLDNANDTPPGAVVNSTTYPGPGQGAAAATTTFTPTTPGTYTFTASADDFSGAYASPRILKMTVNVVPANTPDTPAIAWINTLPGSSLVPPANGQDYWTLESASSPGKPFYLYPGNNFYVDAEATDVLGGLTYLYLDGGPDGDIPPTPAYALVYVPAGNGYSVSAPVLQTKNMPGDYFYSALATTKNGNSQVIHLKITVTTLPVAPTVQWVQQGASGYGPIPGIIQNADGTYSAPGSVGGTGPSALGHAPSNDLASVTVAGPNTSATYSTVNAVNGADAATAAPATSPYSLPGDYVYQASSVTTGNTAQGIPPLTSNTIKLTVHVANHAPTVAWVDPTGSTFQPGSDQSTYTATMFVGESMPVVAQGNDQDGNLSAEYVELGDYAPPATGAIFSTGGPGDGWTAYTDVAQFKPTKAGNYTFSAWAADATGAYSSLVHLVITVQEHPPTVQWLRPTVAPVGQDETASVFVGNTLTVQAEGVGPDGDLIEMDIDQDGVPVDYEFFDQTRVHDSNQTSVGFSTPGSHVLTAKAWTVNGLITDTPSSTITLRVNVPNRAPTFAFTSPNVVNTYVGQTVTIAGLGADQDNNLVRDTVTSAATGAQSASSQPAASLPITFPFTPSAAGTVVFTGTATDDQGAVSQSSQVTVNVDPLNRAPTIIWQGNLNGVAYSGTNASVTANINETVNLTVYATDPDNNLSFVTAKYQGNTYTIPATGGAWSYGLPMTFPAAGTYTFVVTATDSGATGVTYQPPLTSPPATLTVVVTNHAPSVTWTGPAQGTVNTDMTASVFIGATATISAHGSDPDSDLANVTITGDGFPAFTGNPDAGKAIQFPTAGTYTFHAQATDQAGNQSPLINLTVTVSDYPVPTGPVTISAVIVSGATHPEDATGVGEPVVIQGGVISLGDSPLPGTGQSPKLISPVPGYLNGQMVPPIIPFIIDMRIKKTTVNATQ